MSSAPQAQQPREDRAARGVAARLRRDDSGATAVMAAITAPLLLAMAALGAEGGYAYFKHAKMQSVTDVAALSGAAAMKARAGVEGSKLEAGAVATQMGYGASETVTLTVNMPPASGPQASNPKAIEVILALQQEPMLTRMFRTDAYTIRARTVAVAGAGVGGCVVALDPTASGAVSAGGTTNATLNNCSVYANASSAQAISSNGGGVIRATEIHAVGGISGAGISAPTMNSGVAPVADPYRAIPSPASASGFCPNSNPSMVNTDTTLSPGYYCSGLSVKKGVITMLPGVYVVVGGSFSVGAGVTLKGEGVTIITSMHNNYVYTMSISSGATVTLSAPTSGPYAGVVLFADRNIPAAAKISNGIQGGSTQNLTGAVYMPTTDLVYAGGATGNNGCTQIVAKTVTLNGNSTLSANCEGAGTAFIGNQTPAILTD